IADPVFQSIRKQRALRAVYTLNETLHHETSPISWRDSIRPHVFTQPEPEADIQNCGNLHVIIPPFIPLLLNL
ncbi:MAG: hypothetical protein VCD50_12200, partial [Alphaproteobacteria bacterium]